MLLNLNDAASIVAWWQVLPERHDSYLAYKLKASPEFAPAILEAWRRIADSPTLSGLLVESVERRRRQQTVEAAVDDSRTASELRRREFAAVA